MDDDPDLPPAEAVMVAVPPATALTSPVCETVAIAVFDDDQTIVVAEAAGFTVAVNCTVDPAATVALAGDTEIDLTLFGGPPFAKDGDIVSATGGAEVSEHAANANATPAATTTEME